MPSIAKSNRRLDRSFTSIRGLFLISASCVVACSGSSTGSDAGPSVAGATAVTNLGGATATGGANGGALAKGGSIAATGGVNGGSPGSNSNATGGVNPANGGSPGTTSSATGGVNPTNGGSPGTNSNVTGGATAAAGGKTGAGGATATAGGAATATGGKSASGGTNPSNGGTTAAGGAPQTGSCAAPTTGHYQMEDLDRGVVAVKVTGGVYVGWRMMGYEYNPTSPTSIAYNLYRSGTKVATVTNSTNYLDAAGTASSTYTVTAIINGTECAQSPAAAVLAQEYINIPLTPPATGPNGGTYSASDASTGDLDGDGQLDIVLKWDPSNSKDNSQAGITDDVFLDGYTLAGKRLFRIDLGPNIRAGAHYTQFSVYDFDGDGKAEVACKTAPGTKDGTGAYLKTGPAATDTDTTVYRNTDGYILTGPEYLTVFSGATGAELATATFPVVRGTVADWGDGYGNRVDRFNGGFAFVKDGGTASGKPSIIQQRGYYTRLTIGAYTWRGGALTKNWVFDSNGTGNAAAAGQGCHSAMPADVNGDGAMEIIPGASTINSDGTLRCTTKLGHGDALHVGTLIKGKGIQVFMPHENDGGHDLHSADTCITVFAPVGSGDNGRGVAEWVSASNTTSASCSSSAMGSVNCADGSAGAPSPGSNFLIYWDADESRELLNGTTISKSGGGTLLSPAGTASCNGTKSTPTLTADLFGDWREELVLRTSDNTALRVYTTTTVTARRIYTLMHDPQYRAQVSFEQSSYNQPPHVSFHIGAGMADPPKPDIYVK